LQQLLMRPHSPCTATKRFLPVGTELNEGSLSQPRKVFKSEAIGGAKSYLVNLGDLAFGSPTILGGLARRAGSCSTCHVNGASNAKLYIPSLSTRPGTFDTTGGLFNTKATALTSGPAFGATITCCRHGSFICGQHL
jgi:hypothetical protein